MYTYTHKRAFKCMKQNQLTKEVGKATDGVRDFNIPSSTTDRNTRQKMSKEVEEINKQN